MHRYIPAAQSDSRTPQGTRRSTTPFSTRPRLVCDSSSSAAMGGGPTVPRIRLVPGLRPASVKDLFDFEFYGVTTRPGQATDLKAGHLSADIRLFLKRYDINTVIVLPVGRDPAAVTNALVTAIGSPSHFGGVTAWLNVPHLLKTVAPTKSFRINVSPPWTTLLKPEMGAQIDGRQGLIASASSVFGVRSVDFELSGTNLFVRNICRAGLSVWMDLWLEHGDRSKRNVHSAQRCDRCRRSSHEKLRRGRARTN